MANILSDEDGGEEDFGKSPAREKSNAALLKEKNGSRNSDLV